MASQFSISKDTRSKESNMGLFKTDGGKKFSVLFGSTLKIEIAGKTRTRDTTVQITDLETYGDFVKVITKGASKSIGGWLFENVDADLDDVVVTLLLDKVRKWRVFYNGTRPATVWVQGLTFGCILKTTDEGWRKTQLYNAYIEKVRQNSKLRSIHDQYEGDASLIVCHFDHERTLDCVCIVSTNGSDINISALKSLGCDVGVGRAVIGLLINIAENGGYKQLTFKKADVNKDFLDSLDVVTDLDDSSIAHVLTEGEGTITSALFYDITPTKIQPFNKIELFDNPDGTREDVFPVNWDTNPQIGSILTVDKTFKTFPKMDGTVYSFPLYRPTRAEDFMGLPRDTEILAASHNKSKVLLAIIKLRGRDGLRLTAAWQNDPNFDPSKLIKLPKAKKVYISAWKGTVAIVLDEELYYLNLAEFHDFGDGVNLAKIDVPNIDHNSEYDKVGILNEGKIWIRNKNDEIIYYNVTKQSPSTFTNSIWMPNLWGPTRSNIHYY